ncbi:MAG: alpha-1,4-glucan--maltose-1-phosphate maltosyltransferase [Elusimicrobia bacterium GWC2_51_8]|nr:MAG: alpha-1,4-glucan--maltose-1-phosphate maltosyltransferase [Elusimicrobia bacterium GWA2_51_34]OGR60825.1 MAG: alpha-1,4-glucan--maltose-1-phosphate maltosyltransferase [Elusimicrobia bacterium GWC2_51_8]OGR85402.1 MAG: alpha-1,4-glucan--maltose-1-phosphate maltosyltransferase [Elusimicrobia bacterium GWF2_52_66]
MSVESPRRVAIENVRPQIDGGLFPIKRVIGEQIRVEADIFADGHDELACFLLYRRERPALLPTELNSIRQKGGVWKRVPMRPLGNDRWRAEFKVTQLGSYRYTVEVCIDHFATWLRDLKKRLDAGQDARLEIPAGAELIAAAAARAISGKADSRRLKELARDFASGGDPRALAERLSDPELSALVSIWGDDKDYVRFARELEVWVERVRARFSAWYELFPRSCSSKPGRHGTFKDLLARLPYIAGMGFDVFYLPPIHPVGRTHRKGRNNSLSARPGEPGSPWAIGDKTGGHKAIHTELGTLRDFQLLIAAAKENGLELALDIALQCSPDHPWLREHPQWFRRRPDGSLRHAENPPKKYEDIYPLDFACRDWRPLWDEVKSVFQFWMEQGVRIFRVDNPHTKPFTFWDWLIRELRRGNPDLIFLAEAFTRPRVMCRLAKAGFSQSYNYFPWRNSRRELESYFTELTRTEVSEYLRPNLWPNTPDILTEYLQFGGRPAFMIRHVLAATLGASYGIYGPAFELCERAPRDPGQEEYLNSEKYEIKSWDLNRADSIRDFIARVNRVRGENLPLHNDASLRFFHVDNEQLICYGKQAAGDIVIMVVNLDPNYKQSGWVDLPLSELGLTADKLYQMHDLLDDKRYLWRGARNYVELDPKVCPAHIFRLRRYVKTEQDFDYFL